MHPEARNFLNYCKHTFEPFYCNTTRVLDVGSGDINGNNRIYFDLNRQPTTTTTTPLKEYVGCDVYPGPNVTVCMPCHELTYPDAYFDMVISSECFEHDMHYKKTLQSIYRMLANGGLFVFTCASVGRPEHGTRRTTIGDSFSTSLSADSGWPDYYKNLTAYDIVNSFDSFYELFSYSAFYYNTLSKDLYFVGIKNNKDDKDKDNKVYLEYVERGVSKAD